MSALKTVTIPRVAEHEGMLAAKVTVPWVCPTCGRPRGEPFKTVSYDGSKRLHCDGWKNPCGHVDKYAAVVTEGQAAGGYAAVLG